MGQSQKNLKPFCLRNLHSFGGLPKTSRTKPASLTATEQELLEPTLEHSKSFSHDICKTSEIFSRTSFLICLFFKRFPHLFVNLKLDGFFLKVTELTEAHKKLFLKISSKETFTKKEREIRVLVSGVGCKLCFQIVIS